MRLTVDTVDTQKEVQQSIFKALERFPGYVTGYYKVVDHSTGDSWFNVWVEPKTKNIKIKFGLNIG